MSYCMKCGKELKEGEACNCQAVTGAEQNVMEQRKKTKLLVIIGAAIMFIASFMPFYSVRSQSISYVNGMGDGVGDGILIIILAIAAVVLAVTNLQKFGLIPAVLGVGITVFDMSQVKNVAHGIGSFGAGPYLIIVGAIIAGIGSALAIMWKIGRVKR